VIHLVLDHPRLETRGLNEAPLAMLVLGANTHVHRALDVNGHARYREAALLALLELLARPLELGVGERDQRSVGSDSVDEQALRDAQLGGGQADADRVLHDPCHPADLPAQRVVEAVHGGGARLEHGIAELANEGHGRDPPRLALRIQRRSLVALGRRYLGVLVLEIALRAHRRGF
jgi:hypothetical protein